MITEPQVRLLGISGSLRQGSYCTAVLRTLQARLTGKMSMEILLLHDVPLYNADLDGESKPEAVAALKSAIHASDGMVIVSPEYNYGMSGVLKNALDWASRPGYESVLKGKLVLIMTASPGYTGGVRAQAQIRQTLAGTLSRVVPTPEIVIAGVNNKVHEGQLTDEATIAFAFDAIGILVSAIECERALVTDAR